MLISQYRVKETRMGRAKPLPHSISGTDQCYLAWLWRRLASNGRPSKSLCNGFRDTVNPVAMMKLFGLNYLSRVYAMQFWVTPVSYQTYLLDAERLKCRISLSIYTTLNSWLCNDYWLRNMNVSAISAAAYICVICFGNEKLLCFL